MKIKNNWFLPLTLADPYFIAIKAGIATSLTAAMSLYLADNPDLVSACFIAVVSTCPTPLLGLKSSFGQLLNSAIGGFWGILMRVIGLNDVYGVGVAVALGIFCSFIARQSDFWVASAFSAYFVQVIDYNGIVGTMKVRALALSVGSVCALAVNILNSLFFTKHTIRRRMEIAKSMVVRVISIGHHKHQEKEQEKEKQNEEKEHESGNEEHKEKGRGEAVEEGGKTRSVVDDYFIQLENLDGTAQGIFAVLNTLLGELSSVATEAKIIRRKYTWLDQYIFRARKLKQFLHLVLQFAYEAQKAREEVPFSEHETLYKTTKLLLEFLAQELEDVEVAKSSKEVHNAKEENSEKREEENKNNVEMRERKWNMTNLQDFPVEHIKSVAKELVWLLEDIKNGAPATQNRSNGEPLLQNSARNQITNVPTTNNPNQFYRMVGNAEVNIASGNQN